MGGYDNRELVRQRREAHAEAKERLRRSCVSRDAYDGAMREASAHMDRVQALVKARDKALGILELWPADFPGGGMIAKAIAALKGEDTP
jgi:hypothetical protein